MTSLINWLIALGCLFVGSALALWGLTEVNKIIAIWAVAVPGAIMLVLAGGLELTKFAREADKAKIETLNAAKAEDPNRPWISVRPEIGSDLTYDERGDARIIIHFIVQNVGKFPAVNVRVDAEILPIFGDPRPAQKTIADRNKQRPGSLGVLGATIFPGPPQIISINLPISRTAIDAFHKKMADDYGEESAEKMGLMYIPSLVGVADYKFTFADGHHQTGFIMDLRRRSTKNPNIALNFNVADGAIPQSQLWLIPSFVSIPPN
jgi:hypothetical protein